MKYTHSLLLLWTMPHEMILYVASINALNARSLLKAVFLLIIVLSHSAIWFHSSLATNSFLMLCLWEEGNSLNSSIEAACRIEGRLMIILEWAAVAIIAIIKWFAAPKWTCSNSIATPIVSIAMIVIVIITVTVAVAVAVTATIAIIMRESN